ncbi:hypothetical protein HNP60_003003 [Sphingobium sp. B1D3A]|uniref:Uncharacterized protein n=1 Tax=Sphingobium lignivorans TaxID=2735886 RepID=A0ABR6NIC5_9SPHN|nr:hypothetical protein [Sphingobium lignivorans]
MRGTTSSSPLARKGASAGGSPQEAAWFVPTRETVRTVGRATWAERADRAHRGRELKREPPWIIHARSATGLFRDLRRYITKDCCREPRHRQEEFANQMEGPTRNVHGAHRVPLQGRRMGWAGPALNSTSSSISLAFPLSYTLSPMATPPDASCHRRRQSMYGSFFSERFHQSVRPQRLAGMGAGVRHIGPPARFTEAEDDGDVPSSL